MLCHLHLPDHLVDPLLEPGDFRVQFRVDTPAERDLPIQQGLDGFVIDA